MSLNLTCPYRTVCSADVKNYKPKGQLNEFIACERNPLPGKNKCELHMKEEATQNEERLDFGALTRAIRERARNFN